MSVNIFLIFIILACVGIIQAIEPAHGWPIALLYSSERVDYYKYAFIGSSIIAIANIISNTIIVFIYIIVSIFFHFEYYMRGIIAFTILILMAVLSLRNFLLRRKKVESESLYYYENILVSTYFKLHFTKQPYSIKSLFYFGLLLGFLNEEEFAILGIAFSGINPYLLIIIYAITVYFSFILITLFSIKNFENMREGKKLKIYSPIINFLNYLILSILILFDLFSLM